MTMVINSMIPDRHNNLMMTNSGIEVKEQIQTKYHSSPETIVECSLPKMLASRIMDKELFHEAVWYNNCSSDRCLKIKLNIITFKIYIPPCAARIH